MRIKQKRYTSVLQRLSSSFEHIYDGETETSKYANAKKRKNKITVIHVCVPGK